MHRKMTTSKTGYGFPNEIKELELGYMITCE